MLRLTLYETAFGILHKLRAGMMRPDQDRIGARAGEHVEVDETYVFRSLLGIAGGAEAPTYAELYSGDWTHTTCSGCLL